MEVLKLGSLPGNEERVPDEFKQNNRNLSIVLALALYERLNTGSSAVVQTATAFGLIWAGLMFDSGMVANIGTGVIVDLYS